jgi:hypothetical protein
MLLALTGLEPKDATIVALADEMREAIEDIERCSERIHRLDNSFALSKLGWLPNFSS